MRFVWVFEVVNCVGCWVYIFDDVKFSEDSEDSMKFWWCLFIYWFICWCFVDYGVDYFLVISWEVMVESGVW